MKNKIKLIIFLGVFSTNMQAQFWTGIIDSTRAIDWTKVGVSGGIPNRTTIYQTLNPGVTIAQINTAINNCPAGQVVYLSAGSYSLGSGMIVLKSDVTLRGAGAHQTKLYFTGRGNCGGQTGVICMSGSYINGGYGSTPQHLANWTNGYAKGSTVLTFSNTNGLVVGDLVMLEQKNDLSDNGGAYVCADGGLCCYTNGAGDIRPNRHQRQLVTVTAINGNQVTIDQPLYMPNWRSSQVPQARWSGSRPDEEMGLEDLSIDMTAINQTSGNTVVMMAVTNCWVKGVRLIDAGRSHILVYQCNKISIKDNYLYGTNGTGGSVSYGIESFAASSDVLIENNIIQHNTIPVNINDGGTGTVIGYNFTIDNERNPDDLMSGSFWLHAPGISMVLLEGNSGLGFTNDNWYGTANCITLFRNHLYGDIHNNPVKQNHTSPMMLAAYSRFFNCIGNVLGRTGYYNQYEPTSAIGEDPKYIWSLGFSFAYNPGNEVTDAQTKSTLFRWGNYETVSGTTHFDVNEVPSTIPQLANAVPSSQTLPPSFYLSNKPLFFGNTSWPAVGPDVTTGNIANYNGHATTIPARLLWETAPIDPEYGNLNVRTFNASTYYTAVPSSINGFNGSANNNVVTIYPNPASTSLNVLNASINSKITITDVNGREVFSTHVISENQQINIASLPNGAYFIKVKNHSGLSINKKIMVAK